MLTRLGAVLHPAEAYRASDFTVQKSYGGFLTSNFLVSLAAGDYVEIYVRTDAGGQVAIDTGTDPTSAQLVLNRLGP